MVRPVLILRHASLAECSTVPIRGESQDYFATVVSPLLTVKLHVRAVVQ